MIEQQPSIFSSYGWRLNHNELIHPPKQIGHSPACFPHKIISRTHGHAQVEDLVLVTGNPTTKQVASDMTVTVECIKINLNLKSKWCCCRMLFMKRSMYLSFRDKRWRVREGDQWLTVNQRCSLPTQPLISAPTYSYSRVALTLFMLA